MVKNAVCAEVGVESGYFSAQILSRTAPRKLHLFDLAISQIRYDRYPALLLAIEAGVLQLHQGRSVDIISTFPERAISIGSTSMEITPLPGSLRISGRPFGSLSLKG